MTTDTTVEIGWVITEVHDDSDKNRIGYGQSRELSRMTDQSFENVIGRQLFVADHLAKESIPSNKRVRWRSFSDDGDPAYDGIVNIDWLFPEGDDDEDPAYNIDRFCMEDWGAVIVLYNGADIERCMPDKADFVSRSLGYYANGSHSFTPDTTYFAIYG